MDLVLQGRRCVRGSVRVPGDKSISHRAVMLGSIAAGRSRIANLSTAQDVQTTLDAFKAMGVSIGADRDETVIDGRSIAGFEHLIGERRPRIDCRNSGTTARLCIGLLAGSGKRAILDGDTSLRRRPMMRVVQPLCDYGATIKTDRGHLPVELESGTVLPIHYTVPVPSAQVKSALMLAALFIEGQSVIVEPVETRDHTERMLLLMDAKIGFKNTLQGKEIYITGRKNLSPIDLSVPGDISSAVFLIGAALILPASDLMIEDVLLNPTRNYILELFKRMGGRISVEILEEFPEPRGNIRVRHSKLEGIRLGGREIALIIDEIPALAACGFFAQGDTVVTGASELRLKESDRIKGIVHMIRGFGGSIEELDDGFVMHGKNIPLPAEIESFGDHRLAMAASIIALGVDGATRIRHAECVDVSYPGFFQELQKYTV